MEDSMTPEEIAAEVLATRIMCTIRATEGKK